MDSTIGGGSSKERRERGPVLTPVPPRGGGPASFRGAAKRRRRGGVEVATFSPTGTSNAKRCSSSADKPDEEGGLRKEKT